MFILIEFCPDGLNRSEYESLKESCIAGMKISHRKWEVWSGQTSLMLACGYPGCNSQGNNYRPDPKTTPVWAIEYLNKIARVKGVCCENLHERLKSVYRAAFPENTEFDCQIAVAWSAAQRLREWGYMPKDTVDPQ